MGRMRYRSGSYFYLNGNYFVSGDDSRYSGRKLERLNKRCLRVDEDFVSEFPDSIDLKITERCSWGCPFCHESSTPEGKDFDLEKTKEILGQLPPVGIEVAIGGGNVLECPEKASSLIEWLIERGNRPRLTINWKDLKSTGDPGKDEQRLKLINSVSAVGISIQSMDGIEPPSEDSYSHDISMNTDLGGNISCYRVYHVIAGIFPASQLKTLYNNIEGAILVLGYKQWGRAKGNDLPDMTEWKEAISELITERDLDSYNTIGFDNLATEQLGVKELVGDKLWSECYLGDEGTCSMYIDAVKGQYARTSRSPERVDWNKIKLLDFYDTLKH